jgi:CheY-like chemotaxis protein
MWFSKIKQIVADSKKKQPFILVVDDDFTNLRMLRDNLEAEGYLVETAMDGMVGRQMAVERRPDLIISDIYMPGQDGLSMMESLSKVPGFKTPIILMSGRAQENYLAKVNDSNQRYALLKKPLILRELNQLIKSFLAPIRP